MAGYIEQQYPDIWKKVDGKSRLTDNLTNQLSDCGDIADALWSLCLYSSRLTMRSARSIHPVVFVNQKRHNQSRNWRYINKHSSKELFKALLGWSTALISHERFYQYSNAKKNNPNYQLLTNKVDWYVQEISIVNDATGEIDEDLPENFSLHCNQNRIKTALYKLDEYRIGCIVVIPTRSHKEAVKKAQELAAPFTSIKHGDSSLYREYPLPLTLNRNGYLCSFVDDVDGRATFEVLFSDDQEDTETELEEESVPTTPIDIQPHTPRTFFRKDRIIKTDWMVESSFREQLIQEFGDDRIILALIGLFLFGSFRDADDDAFAVIDTETMLQILGKKHSKKNLISSNLQRLGTLISIETTRPFYVKSKATRFRIIDVPEYMKQAQEQKNKPKVNPVLLSDGISKRIKHSIVDIGINEKTVYPNDVSSQLLSYLNNLPSNSFQSRTKKHWEKMIVLADNLTAESKEQSLSALSAIQQNPKPTYTQGLNTVRLYADGGHYQTLKKDIRDLVFDGCIKLDLAHSQLSIAAHITQAESLLRLCSSGELWDYLIEKTGIEKAVIKEFIYSVLFTESEVINEDDLPAHIKKAYRELVKTPEISEFLEKRTEYLIYNFNDSTTDAFNNKLTGRNNQKFNSLVSSIELLILKPGIEYMLNKDSRTKIVLWLHDGFYLSGSEKETIFNAKCIIDIVNNELLKLKIPTKLIME
jgi:hypothetical protein